MYFSRSNQIESRHVYTFLLTMKIVENIFGIEETCIFEMVSSKTFLLIVFVTNEVEFEVHLN